MAAMILGFFISLWVGITCIFIFKAAIILIFKDVSSKIKHRSNYTKILKNIKRNKFEIPEEEENQENSQEGFKLNISNLLEESSFSNIFENIPRVSAFIGYYSLSLIKKKVGNSVDLFCNFLFREVTNPNEEKMLYESSDTDKYLEMKEKYLKNYYEKFCFLNDLLELKLSNPENVIKFEKYGYTLKDDITESITFRKIVRKKIQKIPSRHILLKSDSFDIFFKTFYNVTNIEEDFEWAGDMQEVNSLLSLIKKNIN